MAAIMAAVVDLPLEPVTPIAAAGQSCRNRSISVVSADAVFPGDGQPRIFRPHRRVDHDEIGLAKIGFPVPAKVEGGEGQPAQLQSRGQDRFIRQIGHGDARALAASQRAAAAPPPNWPRPMTVTYCDRQDVMLLGAVGTR